MALTINGRSTNNLVLKQQEGKKITFTYNVSISQASFDLVCKDSEGNTKFTKTDSDFDKTEINSNKVSVTFTTADLDLEPARYKVEVKATWDSQNDVDKTLIMKLDIEESLFT